MLFTIMARTYQEKLQDPRWAIFGRAYRARVKEKFGLEDQDLRCDSCAEARPLQVHHRRYIKGREPWEYEDEDLALLCAYCHGKTHEIANEFYSWFISIDPHWVAEAEYFLKELVKSTHQGCALAHCKNAVRRLNHSKPLPTEED